MGYYKGNKYWSADTIWGAAKGKPSVQISVNDLSDAKMDGCKMILPASMQERMESVMSADMEIPIILTPDHQLLDGYHRLCKAMVTKMSKIKAVFLDPASDDFPLPDYDANN